MKSATSNPSHTATPEIVELLSQIIGQSLPPEAITSPVLFLAALTTVLLGIMLADQVITEEEKLYWQKALNRFIPDQGSVRQLAVLLSKGIRTQQVYTSNTKLLTLTLPFSQSQKLLLVGFGYEMSAADGSIDERERIYLHKIAQCLGVAPHHLEVIEAGLTHMPVTNLDALKEVKFLLDPARFHDLDQLFVSAASDFLDRLPTVLIESHQTHTSAIQDVFTYQQLASFQQRRRELQTLVDSLFQLIQNSVSSGFLPDQLLTDIQNISQKLASKSFSIAVLGGIYSQIRE